MELSTFDFSLIALSAFILGLTKSGLKGIDVINVIILAHVLGSKSSTGFLVPLLCIADIMAVAYYRRNIEWPIFFKLIPWILVGMSVGIYTGKYMNEELFNKFIFAIVLVTILLIYLIEIRQKNINIKHPVFAPFLGISVGFTTMIGNLAGTFSNIYFLSMRINKTEFIGTAAFLFLVINLIKLPFQLFYWKNITTESLQLNFQVLPFLFVGFYLGLKMVDRLSEKSFRNFVLICTLLGSALLLLK
jgi:uncharacterized protein